MTCGKCGYKQFVAFWDCPKCGYNEETDKASKLSAIKEGQHSESGDHLSIAVKIPGEGAIEALKAFAWLDLVVSIIATVLILSNASTPYAVGLGLGILFQGLFACALFLVIASIAENIIIIRKAITKVNNVAT
jgi:RNA polymerase subunit RPABC4/transcription elongation factor Spt4